jgi:hypothetical protein
MQTVGAAGVYGNPLPAAQDFAKASPVPNDVWIAKYSSPPQLTVWGLGKLADSTNWANGQRIHQVQQNLKQTWATTAYFVDPDIENGPVPSPLSCCCLSEVDGSTALCNNLCVRSPHPFPRGVQDD